MTNTRSSSKKLRSAKILMMDIRSHWQPNLKKRPKTTNRTRNNKAAKITSAAASKPKQQEYIEIFSDSDDDVTTVRTDAPEERENCISLQIEQITSQVESLEKRVKIGDNQLKQKDELIQNLSAILEGTEKKAAMDRARILDLLSCDVCSHVLREPYVLPTCGHTFCAPCLNSWDDAIGEQHQNHLAHGIDFREPPFTCPSCRTPLEGKPIAERPVVNFFVKNLVEHLNLVEDA